MKLQLRFLTKDFPPSSSSSRKMNFLFRRLLRTKQKIYFSQPSRSQDHHTRCQLRNNIHNCEAGDRDKQFVTNSSGFPLNEMKSIAEG